MSISNLFKERIIPLTTAEIIVTRNSKALSINGPKIIVFVLDSSSVERSRQYWEHTSDVVIRLDYYYQEMSNYLIRYIEIVKARYQSHVWGRHQLKIYSKNKKNKDLKPALPHPYREEGGIFIYPSIHLHLSRYKRKSPETLHGSIQMPLKRLNKILGEDETEGGMPKGRCTAMIGSRGTHKSHLGYYILLNNIKENRNCHHRGLIISLRDDVGLAINAMSKFMPKNEVESYIKNDDLEILFFPPGYITPEEFYHRILMSLLRLKRPSKPGEEVHVTVLFNSLDQLSARFPLCAKEDVFIPGLIDTFTAEKVTSIFISVDEPGQPEHQYGLLTMADLIISFHQRLFDWDDYFGHIKSTANHEQTIPDLLRNEFGDEIYAVVLRVERFAGGQRAGDGGILELVQKDPIEKLYSTLFNGKQEKLVFIPFNAGFGQGKTLN